MSLIIESRTQSTPPTLRSPVRLKEAAPALWRVLDTSGRVIGHVQQVAEPGGIRFRARRYHPGSHAFRDLGDFWNADDAIDCLRFTR